MTKTLSPAAADALRSATADDTSITLRCGQLDRPVYVEVNKALTRIGGGGRWDRRADAHLYSRDPRPDLAALLGDGSADLVMPVDADKEASFWRTPPAVVDEMLDRIGILELRTILEPSAGDGAIADTIRRVNSRAELVCVEPDPQRADVLTGRGHVVIRATLEDYAARTVAVCGVGAPSFDGVVMNPPFTLPGRPTAWADHIELCLDLLAPGGRLIAVTPSSYAHRDTRRLAALRGRVEALRGTWGDLDDDAFRESGTGVRTGLLLVTVPGDPS